MKIRRARNQIEKIQVDSQEVKGANELKKTAYRHFKNLLLANEEMAESEDFLKHTKKKKIKKDQNVAMCKDPTEEEVVATIWILHPDKAPRPDGFTIAFYRFHWYTIRKDFLRMVNNIFKKKENRRQQKILLSCSNPKGSKPLNFQ